MKHQNLPIQNMTGRAVMEEFDQYSMASSTHSEGENTVPECFKNYPLNIQISDRSSQASNNTQTI